MTCRIWRGELVDKTCISNWHDLRENRALKERKRICYFSIEIQGRIESPIENIIVYTFALLYLFTSRGPIIHLTISKGKDRYSTLPTLFSILER